MGAVTQGVVGGVVWCRVRRSKTGSERVSLEALCGVCRGQGSQIQDPAVTQVCRGQGSQIQDRAVTQGVVGGVVWCVEGSGFADSRRGCHTGCRWRCCVVCVGVRVRRSKTGLSHRVSLEVLCGVCRGQGSQIQDRAVTQGWRCCVVCVGVRVRRSKTGLSHRVSLEVLCGVCRGQGSQIQDPAVTHGSQIQDRAVTQGVVGGVVWCV